MESHLASYLLECSDEYRRDYWRYIDTFRRKEQRRGNCSCKKFERFECDMDCFNCRFYVRPDFEFLDEPIDDERTVTRADLLADPHSLLDESDLATSVAAIVDKLPEFDKQICEFLEVGLSFVAIADRLSVSEATIRYHVKNLRPLFSNLRK